MRSDLTPPLYGRLRLRDRRRPEQAHRPYRPAPDRPAAPGMPDEPGPVGDDLADWLSEAVTPRVAALAGPVFDPSGAGGPRMSERIRCCLRIALGALAADRGPTDHEYAELLAIGRALAEAGDPPPSLVGMHSVLLLGHSESLRLCHCDTRVAASAGHLGAGGRRVLEISEQLTTGIGEGYADERFARRGGAERLRPVDALAALITGSVDSWQQAYLTRVVREGRLNDVFPAVLAVGEGSARERPGSAAAVRFARGGEGVVARVQPPGGAPHTLVLGPADGLPDLRAWVTRSMAGPVVLSRAVGLDEAPARYRATLDLLPLCSRAEPAERVVDARRLLWHKMLASQRTEFVGDYVDEVIGPLLRLPETQRAPLMETLEALDRHGGSVRAAAEDLFVHEKTIRYRIRRIESLTGLNALSRPDWPALHRAVQLTALFPAVVAP